MKLFMKGFAGVCIVVLSGCSSLFYYPTRKTYHDPSKAGLVNEDVEFVSESGDKIHAWWFGATGKESKGTVVFFHGNAENLTSHFANLMWLPAEGYNYFIFDYPGYGRSSGHPTPMGALNSGIAAIRWVVKNKDQRPLIVYGHSLGGNIALRSVLDLKDSVPFRAVIIDSSFPSYRKIAARKLSSFWLTWPFQPLVYAFLSDRYAPDRIDALSPTPLLVIHGQKDIQVEPEFGEMIFKAAKEPKQIWRIPDGSHGSTFWRHERVYRKKLLRYLEDPSRDLSGESSP